MPRTERTYQYLILDIFGDEPTEFKSTWDDTQEYHQSWIAEDAAKHFFEYFNGWESSWPIEITVVGVGTFTVELEYDPAFMATRVRKEIKE